MSYQAVPPGSDLIERAIADLGVGSLLSSVAFRMTAGDAAAESWPPAAELHARLGDLRRAHPGLEARNCFLDHEWDVLHYLLSPKRRGETAHESDGWCDVAVRGGAPLGDHVCGSQGVPVRYISPSDVAEIATHLEILSFGDLASRYMPVEMEAAGLYRFRASDAGTDCEWLQPYFAAFRAFYVDAARHGEGQISTLAPSRCIALYR